jgi:hypothetical protein
MTVNEDINIGAITEALNDKMDKDGMNAGNPACVVVESRHEGTEWYRIYSDGWCEQGGYVSSDSTVPLLKTFIDTNYSVTFGLYGSSNGVPRLRTKTVNSFDYESANYASCPAFWEAKGYIS